MNRDLRLWEADYQAACMCLMVGLCLGWTLQFAGYSFMAAIACVTGMLIGWMFFRQGKLSEDRKDAELRAVETLRGRLPVLGYAVRSGRIAPGGGADLTIRLPSDKATFVIEIEPYGRKEGRWWRLLTKAGRFDPLLSEPPQVQMQCRYLGPDRHFPVLWCPTSQENDFDLHQDLLLVHGGVDLLIRSLHWYRENVRVPARVRFEDEPPLQYRKELIRRKLIYSRKLKNRSGHVTLRDGAYIADLVPSADGRFNFRKR